MANSKAINLFVFFFVIIVAQITQQLNNYIQNSLLKLNLGPDFIFTALLALTGFLFSSIPIVIIEFLFPKMKIKPRNYIIASLAWFTGFLTIFLSTKISVYISENSIPLLKITADNYNLSIQLLLLIFSLFLYDFFYYWWHRLQHRYFFLWRFHAIHHSIEDLNCINSFHHPLEDLFRILPISLTLYLIIKIEAIPVIFILSALISSWSIYIHSSTEFNFGIYRKFFADNVYHRTHHSIEDKHRDKNFAAFFPILDMIFGTHYNVIDTDWPEVGILNKADSSSNTPKHKLSISEFILGVNK